MVTRIAHRFGHRATFGVPGPEDTGYNLTLGGRSFRHWIPGSLGVLEASGNQTWKIHHVIPFGDDVLKRTNYLNSICTLIQLHHSPSIS